MHERHGLFADIILLLSAKMVQPPFERSYWEKHYQCSRIIMNTSTGIKMFFPCYPKADQRPTDAFETAFSIFDVQFQLICKILFPTGKVWWMILPVFT